MSPNPSRPLLSGAEWCVLFLSLKGRATLGEFLKKVPKCQTIPSLPSFLRLHILTSEKFPTDAPHSCAAGLG